LPTYLQPVETDVVTLPSSTEIDKYTVRMKRRASYGDQLEAQTAMLQVDQTMSGMVTKMEYAAYIRALTARLIIDWNLSDENGGPLPITPANIDRLRQEDGEFLAAEAQKRLRLREQADEAPFVKPSSDS
jgi:hypothetical protein